MKKIFTFLSVLMALMALPQTAGAQNATFDVEVANIADFFAVEDGKTVKLTLTDARVNAFADLSSTYYVEDATGAVAVKGIGLTKGTKLNGYFIGVKSTEDVDYMNDPSQGLEYQITVDGTNSSYTSAATELVGTEMTITEACQQANYGKLITLSNVDIAALGNGMNKKLTDANGNTMKTRDLFGVLPSTYTWPAKASKITGVALYYMTGWFLMPISAEAIVEAPAEFDFHNNNLGLTPGENGDNMSLGNLENVTLTKGNVSLTFVSSPTMPTRFYDNGTRGKQLQLIKDGMMRVTAAEGKAITAIRFVYNLGKNTATGADVYNTSWNVDKGEGTFSADKKNWTGNAKSVRFKATSSVYVDSIIVETADATSETITPAADTYTAAAATLAAFNELADGTLVKLTLKDAVVTSGMNNEWGYYVQDATAGAHFYCTGLTFNVNDVLNGYVYVKKNNQNMGARIAMTEETNDENITITSGAYEPIEATKVADVNKAANKLKVVKLTGVALKGTSATAGTITDSDNGTIDIAISTTKSSYYSDVYHESLNGVNYTKATVVGILFGSSATVNKIMPLSITDETSTAINDIKAAEDAENVVIYNLQGVRLNKLQKGVNIVNGKKIVVK